MERPRTLTKEMTERAARAVVQDLAKAGHIKEVEIEDSVRDIAKHARSHMDGYELAKTLDDYAHWDCNLDMAETLDGFSSYARDEIEAAEKVWFALAKPIPPFDKGARIKLKSGETGLIDGIYAYGTAKFLVKIDGDKEADTKTQSRRIINFEDAQAA